MPEPIIKLKNLEITYNLGKENEYKATRGVSMEIYPEEYVAFFGPSGCGKSTLFYCILGILPPSAGEILVKGRNPYAFSPNEMVEFQTRTIGIIYQAFYLIPSLSVVDNVALPQIFQGAPPHERRRRAMALLKRFDIDSKADVYPENLSGGQSQRVSVARALMNNPDILLADEPTGNLDSIATKQVMDALESINKDDRKTVVIITHNAAQLKYAHRVFYMKDGKVERVVPNPEKKQIAKVDKLQMLVTEMEKLSRMFPYDTPLDLKVRSLINYLTQDVNFDQIQRLETAGRALIEGKIDFDKFFTYLTIDQDQGGVGLSRAKARQITDKAARVLKEAQVIRRYRRHLLRSDLFAKQEALIRKLKDFLAAEYGKQLTAEQARVLKAAIYDRLSGNLHKHGFNRRLRLPLSQGGVGLGARKARALTIHFEKILTQGLVVQGAEH